MKYKLIFALAAAAFGASIGIDTAKADDASCLRACRTQYQLCMQYTPDKAALCQQAYVACRARCGGGMEP